MMWKCCSWIPVMVMAMCLPALESHAQNLSVDMSTLKLLTLNDLRSVVGMVSDADTMSITIMKLNRTTLQVPRRSVMKAQVIYVILRDEPDESNAGPDTSISMLELIGDVRVAGRLLNAGPSGVTLRQMDGICIYVPSSAIREAGETVSMLIGDRGAGLDTSTVDQGDYSLFIMPTGRAQRNNGITLSLIELIACGMSVGIADVITMSGGVALFSGVVGTLKFTVPSTKWIYISGGIIVSRYSEEQGSTAISPFVATTVGNDNISLTTDLMGWYEGNGLMVIGAEIRVSGTVKFIFEDWIRLSKYDNDNGIGYFMLGIRSRVSRTLSFEFGSMIVRHKFSTNSGSHDEVIPLPWASVSLYL